MKIRDYLAAHEGYYIAPEVQYACELLERQGEMLFLNFTFSNAVDKAAEMLSVFMDEAYDWAEIRRLTRSRDPHGDWT